MSQPEGFIDPQKPHHVCKLDKALYGLKQAPRAWYDSLKHTLCSWNFKQSQCDSSLFFYRTSKHIIFALVYVDDIIITGNDISLMQSFIQQLNQKFSLKDLGDLHHFLGIEVRRDHSGLFLTQTRYITDLLSKFDMAQCKSCLTPMSTGKLISANDSSPLANPTMYRSVVGALQYLTHTRPDIAFVVNRLSQFLSAPTDAHWKLLKRVFRYLQGSLHLGLHIQCNERVNLMGFSDANWASCPDDRRSVAGYCVFLGETMVSWSSKKQSIVARSSTEAEYRALAHVAAEITWIQSLFKEIGIPKTGVPITWCDNMSANALASNPVFHARTKHIEIDVHFVRNKVLNHELDVRFIPSYDQVADLFTKPLPHSRFLFLRDKLGLRMVPSSLRGC